VPEKNKLAPSFINASLMNGYRSSKPNVARDTARLFDIVRFARYPKAARCERSEDD
jgi:hypothetical protein